MTDTTMTTPKTASDINAALADLQTQLPHIAKNNKAEVPTKTGGKYTYQYADLAEITRQLLPLLGKLGLSFTSRPTMLGEQLVLVYELRHVSGEQIDGVYPLPGRGTPQEVGSAITYARRYCLCAVSGLAPDNDDEDAVLAETAARKQRVERVEEKIAAAQAPSEPRITAGQQRDMQTLFQGVGTVEKTDKLKYAIKVVKRPINSATELTQDEAGKVIDALRADAANRADIAPVAEDKPAGEVQ
ncbi:ERF family protein [Actinoplanes sp. CA-051413]|uniref:ERF family protein n=1 Tax=Actinoplanes sp. CA-051413 TaxID=3239899 RepID=UPI003D97C61F